MHSFKGIFQGHMKTLLQITAFAGKTSWETSFNKNKILELEN